MATYHFSVKNSSRGSGSAHYAYIARLEPYQHVRKKSQEQLEHVQTGGCMPNWVKEPAQFWKAADQYERKNAKVYTEYEFALPSEFSVEQRKTLVETFVAQHIASHRYPHSYAIHNVKSRLTGQPQPHCHLMFSLRADDGLERSAEQYFKRYNPKDPSAGGARKRQLQEGHENYSAFLLHIRKAWEDHLNDALALYCPTIEYKIGHEVFEIKNQVSAGNYDQYNHMHGTLYIPEPKLGPGTRQDQLQYLQELHKIRQHNHRERDREHSQRYANRNLELILSYTGDVINLAEAKYYAEHMMSTMRVSQHDSEKRTRYTHLMADFISDEVEKSRLMLLSPYELRFLFWEYSGKSNYQLDYIRAVEYDSFLEAKAQNPTPDPEPYPVPQPKPKPVRKLKDPEQENRYDGPSI